MQAIKNLYPWILTNGGELVRALERGEKPIVDEERGEMIENGLLFVATKARAREHDKVLRIVCQGDAWVVRDWRGRVRAKRATYGEARVAMEELSQW